MATSSKGIEDSVICPWCGLQLNIEEMVQHMDDHNRDMDAEINADERDAMTLKCPMCSFTSISPKSLELHLDSEHFDLECSSVSFSCPFWQHMDDHIRDMDAGISADERGAMTLECPMCSFTSISPKSLELHLDSEHFDLECSSVSFSCPFCTDTFPDSKQLQMHVDTDHKENVPNICPVCVQCDFHSSKELALHVEKHFSEMGNKPNDSWTQEMERRERERHRWEEQREFEKLKSRYGMNDNGGFQNQMVTDMQRAVQRGSMSVADYHERQIQMRAKEQQGSDDQHSCTKGLIPIMREFISRSPITTRVYLCSDADHYQSTYGDKGWGCGYRNLQMLISALSKHKMYAECLKAAFGANLLMPSIPKLQQQIESAWLQGFDLQGSKQLGSKLHQTSKWIGATEVVALLSSLRIKCQLVDFHRPTALDGGHPELFNWVLEYFRQCKDLTLPLYLQHEGHSRTIVGIEQLRENKLQLLVFDPSHYLSQMKNPSSVTKCMRLIRKQYLAMKHKQYQIVAVTGIMANSGEYQRSKVLQSRRIP